MAASSSSSAAAAAQQRRRRRRRRPSNQVLDVESPFQVPVVSLSMIIIRNRARSGDSSKKQRCRAGSPLSLAHSWSPSCRCSRRHRRHRRRRHGLAAPPACWWKTLLWKADEISTANSRTTRFSSTFFSGVLAMSAPRITLCVRHNREEKGRQNTGECTHSRKKQQRNAKTQTHTRRTPAGTHTHTHNTHTRTDTHTHTHNIHAQPVGRQRAHWNRNTKHQPQKQNQFGRVRAQRTPT